MDYKRRGGETGLLCITVEDLELSHLVMAPRKAKNCSIVGRVAYPGTDYLKVRKSLLVASTLGRGGALYRKSKPSVHISIGR